MLRMAAWTLNKHLAPASDFIVRPPGGAVNHLVYEKGVLPVQCVICGSGNEVSSQEAQRIEEQQRQPNNQQGARKPGMLDAYLTQQEENGESG